MNKFHIPSRKIIDINYRYFILLPIFYFSTCTLVGQSIEWVYPSIASAKSLIVTDTVENYFDRIENMDLAIQVGTSKNISRDSLLSAFKSKLSSSPASFSQNERYILDSLCTVISQQIEGYYLPIIDTINLIKIDKYTVGDEAFYTRQNSIIIPQGALDKYSATKLHTILLHELYHIYSRYDHDFKAATYRLIGFERHEKQIEIPKELKQKMLLNPDGLNMDFAITLHNKQKDTCYFIPFLFTSNKDYNSNSPHFFSYMKFDLFPLKIENDYAILDYQKVKNFLIDPSYYEDYFKQIKDNTSYTIHPDEIMADNFAVLIMEGPNSEFSNFSVEGKKLLIDLLYILQSKQLNY